MTRPLNGPGLPAVVVGSGPNGLAAGITLARSGYSVSLFEGKDTIGGGLRSAELTLPGYVHDLCSAIHPMGIASPFFRGLDLKSFGLDWIHPPAALAHPLDDGTAVLLEKSIDKTAEKLGPDANDYRKLMRSITGNWNNLLDEVLRPVRFPRHPVALARFGLNAIQSTDRFIQSHFKANSAKALFAGIAAHSILPTDRAGGAAYALILGAAAHAVGWPLAKGGSQSIANALKHYFVSLGGQVRIGYQVRSLGELPKSRLVLLDITPRQLGQIAGNLLPAGYRQQLLGYQYGPGVFKMDWALNGPIPWRAPECLRAATVHVGGTFEEIAAAENAVWKGEHPERPLVILAQPSLFDPSRAPPGRQTAWAYCHVPNGSTVDMSGRIESQVERFAPGFREHILARSAMNTAALEEYNPNYVGGDIAGGIQLPLRMMARSLKSRRGYGTPIKGIYLCSSSVPPGAGVHGMCGYNAARAALDDLSYDRL